ncbi:Hypothetical predicted protein [Cloeon dipterum]|uniref:Uncharacterized protein n=1 Tax=Cloeon dipterum TaxID=197152 RepID=A0A8S1E3L0_9INSE|nr:Hypothetical predicted protein [Cloeon dipterum]
MQITIWKEEKISLFEIFIKECILIFFRRRLHDSQHCVRSQSLVDGDHHGANLLVRTRPELCRRHRLRGGQLQHRHNSDRQSERDLATAGVAHVELLDLLPQVHEGEDVAEEQGQARGRQEAQGNHPGQNHQGQEEEGRAETNEGRRRSARGGPEHEEEPAVSARGLGRRTKSQVKQQRSPSDTGTRSP